MNKLLLIACLSILLLQSSAQDAPATVPTTATTTTAPVTTTTSTTTAAAPTTTTNPQDVVVGSAPVTLPLADQPLPQAPNLPSDLLLPSSLRPQNNQPVLSTNGPVVTTVNLAVSPNANQANGYEVELLNVNGENEQIDEWAIDYVEYLYDQLVDWARNPDAGDNEWVDYFEDATVGVPVEIIGVIVNSSANGISAQDPARVSVAITTDPADDTNIPGSVYLTSNGVQETSTQPATTTSVATTQTPTTPTAVTPVTTTPVVPVIPVVPVETVPVATTPVATTPVATTPVATEPVATTPVATTTVAQPAV